MSFIELRIHIPDSLDVERVADLHHVIADAAHRAKDWCDEADWSITQHHRGEFTVTAPLSLQEARR